MAKRYCTMPENLALFDLYQGNQQPLPVFGEIQLFVESPPEFAETLTIVLGRVVDGFDWPSQTGWEMIELIDDMVKELWKDGWNRKTNNLELFATDLGILLMDSCHRMLGGDLVLREGVNLLHASLWWPEHSVEFFPFHSIARRLYSEEESSIRVLVTEVERILESKS
jgi:hypothetical protein